VGVGTLKGTLKQGSGQGGESRGKHMGWESGDSVAMERRWEERGRSEWFWGGLSRMVHHEDLTFTQSRMGVMGGTRFDP
jgi:hypothetical protein